MADQRPFAGMSQEDTNQAIVQLLAAILDKLPRTDINDRLIVNGSEVANASAPVTLASLPTLSTLVDLNRINAMGATAATSRPADAIPLQIANIGALHIYDNIRVT